MPLEETSTYCLLIFSDRRHPPSTHCITLPQTNISQVKKNNLWTYSPTPFSCCCPLEGTIEHCSPKISHCITLSIPLANPPVYSYCSLAECLPVYLLLLWLRDAICWYLNVSHHCFLSLWLLNVLLICLMCNMCWNYAVTCCTAN